MLEICVWKWRISSTSVLTGLLRASRQHRIPNAPQRSKTKYNFQQNIYFAEGLLNSFLTCLGCRKHSSETTMPFRNRAGAPRRLSNIASGQVMWSHGTNPSAWTYNGLFRGTDFSNVFVPTHRQSFVREFVATDRKRPHIRRGREGGRLPANISATSSTNARQPQSPCARPARPFE